MLLTSITRFYSTIWHILIKLNIFVSILIIITKKINYLNNKYNDLNKYIRLIYIYISKIIFIFSLHHILHYTLSDFHINSILIIVEEITNVNYI